MPFCFAFIIMKYLRLGRFIRKRGLLWLIVLEVLVWGFAAVMSFFLAKSQGGTEHYLERNREHVYVIWSLLIGLPVFSHGGFTVMNLSIPNCLPKALP